MAEAALDALGEGVVFIADGRVTGLNAAASRLLQVDPERAVGSPVLPVLRDHRMERAHEDGAPVEVVTRGRSVQVVPFTGGLVLRDVTDERRARADARELLAVLSHELRTPVTTIRSALEALRYEMPASQRDRFLEQAETEADRLVRLLDDLTVDIVPSAARRVALRATAERAQALLRPTLERHQVSVVLRLPGTDVWCDPDKLLQLFVNLIENAARHGPDASVVQVVAAPDAERPLWYAVEVHDEGTPLPLEVLESFFSPHTRGSGASGRGTGLGLYIVRSIVDRWSGRAYARPLRPLGNAFGFTVPRERPALRGER